MCGRMFVRSIADELLKDFAWARTNLANAGDFWPRYNVGFCRHDAVVRRHDGRHLIAGHIC